MPIRTEFRRCLDKSLLFRVDTITDVYIDSPATSVHFPYAQGIYKTSSLPPGCYQIAVIARDPNDGDHTNDTAYANFTIKAPTPLVSNDVSVEFIYSPINESKTLISHSITPSVRLRNLGSSAEMNIPVFAVIRNSVGLEVYRDSTIISSMASLGAVDFTFRMYQPTLIESAYTLSVYTSLSNDEFRKNDTASNVFFMRAYQDLDVAAIISPSKDTIFPKGTPFWTSVECTLLKGRKITTPISITATFLRTSDSMIRGISSASMPSSNIDTLPFLYYFPYVDKYSLSNLDTGDYSLTVTARYRDDNPSNDTARTKFSVRYAHNIRLDSIIRKDQLPRIPVGDSIPITLALTSQSMFTDSVVMATLQIFSSNGGYSTDTAFAYNVKGGSSFKIKMKNFYTADTGSFLFAARSYTANDQNRLDDGISIWLYARHLHDIYADSVLYPRSADSIPEGVAFSVIGTFYDKSALSESNIPVRLEIRNCADHSLAFRADTTIDTLTNDGPKVAVTFPYAQNTFDTQKLPGGCYRVAIIARQPGDSNQVNDTAYSTFTILSSASVKSPSNTADLSFDQNYPNPFSASTSFNYFLPSDGRVSFRIVDMMGRVIKTAAADELETAGDHRTEIDLRGSPEGVYVAELTFTNALGASRSVRRMILLAHSFQQ
ncbi:MAG TPA: T9SS type A sorting domain-containing protein [Candidatus Kapabacteria bacterium]|nr:T9SS type A sorting domain-containing protein [Candidatus Kapabacteria bacterium]